MSRSQRLAPLLIAIATLAGCASPETYDHTAVRVVAAVPFLTWVDGDPEDGTTTLVSLPLLTYRTTEDGPGYRRSSACVLPLLGRFEQTDRYPRLDWPRTNCPDDPPEKPVGEGLAPSRASKKKKGTMRIEVVSPRRTGELELAPTRRRTQPARRRSARTRARPTPRRRSTPARRAPRITRSDPAPAPQSAPTSALPVGTAVWVGEGRHRRMVLTLDGPATIVRQKPAQSTDAQLLFPLIRLKTERPALLAVRSKDGGAIRIYELGATEDEIRILPLFSFARKARHKELIIWPLFASGYETEGEKTYLRLFYFLRIPL